MSDRAIRYIKCKCGIVKIIDYISSASASASASASYYNITGINE